MFEKLINIQPTVPPFLAIAAILGIPSSVPIARAEDSTAQQEYLQNIRVLGKGIESRDTAERLQLACVGAPLAEGSLERSCEFLQFVVAEPSRLSERIGPIFSIQEGHGKFKGQLKAQLLQAGVTRTPTEEETAVFSKLFYDPISGNGVKNSHGVPKRLLLAVVWTNGAMLAGFLAASLPLAVAVVMAPFLFDRVFRPVTKSLIKRQGGALAKVNNIKALNDRSEIGWQLKPRRIDHKYFVQALTALHNGSTPAGGLK